MLRYIFIGVLIYIISKAIKKLLFAVPSKIGDPTVTCSEMVKCSKCGTYVYKNDTRMQNGAQVCSTDCLK